MVMSYYDPYNPYGQQYNQQYSQQYNPYIARLQMPQQTNLIRVKGEAGADAFRMGPNCQAALFDEDSDTFWFKVTDGGGFPTKRRFAFMEVFPDPAPAPASAPQDDRYVSRAEFGVMQDDLHKLSEQLNDLVQSLGGVKDAQ